MDKQRADHLISQYQNKIFGFAMKKMRNISQAQELAGDIVCEVYLSFLRADEIINVDGYVYRISCNIYARHIHRIKTERDFADVTELVLPYHETGYERLEHRETMERLRREIGFLSKRQKTILYLHYYEQKSVAEIGDQLGISPGTVKWHLSDARTTLKEELVMNQYNDNLTMNPIRFISMGHDGTPGEKGDTNDIFDTQLKQNIAWYCYHTPHTVDEIARSLSVPSVYISDELNVLEEYGYLDRMDKSANPKFRTNMVIYDARIDNHTDQDLLYHDAVMKLCDEFFPKVFADFEHSADLWGFTCDGNDKNYMKYNLVMLCIRYLSGQCDSKEIADYWDSYAVERPDGGKFIAHACVSDSCHIQPQAKEKDQEDPDTHDDGYAVCGFMIRNFEHSVFSLQINCRYSSRNGGWQENMTSDWQSVHEFLSRNCRKDAIAPESYKRLCDTGYISGDRLQIMSIQTDTEDKDSFLRQLIEDHITISEDLKAYSAALDEKIYAQQKDRFPQHILPIIRGYSACSLCTPTLIPRLIEEMLNRGMLKPLTEVQKQSVFTVMAYSL